MHRFVFVLFYLTSFIFASFCGLFNFYTTITKNFSSIVMRKGYCLVNFNGR